MKKIQIIALIALVVLTVSWSFLMIVLVELPN